jgi:HlyD family secretion protein
MEHQPMKNLMFWAAALLLLSCADNGRQFAYTGRTDVDAILLSSQAAGLIDSLPAREGQAVRKGEVLARINTERLRAQAQAQSAQLAQLELRRDTAEAQLEQAQAQVRQAQARLELAQETLARTESLLTEGGATRQRRDELATQLTVEQANLAALRSNQKALESGYKLIGAQEQELRAGMQLTGISIRDAELHSPIDGVVLNTFRHEGELAAVGTPLLEVADLSTLRVEVYVPLAKLGALEIGGEAQVSAEGVPGILKGTVSWIASEAEFTPKTILTQETRTTLVYRVRILVANPDGILKVGMPVDVRF